MEHEQRKYNAAPALHFCIIWPHVQCPFGDLNACILNNSLDQTEVAVTNVMVTRFDGSQLSRCVTICVSAVKLATSDKVHKSPRITRSCFDHLHVSLYM